MTTKWLEQIVYYFNQYFYNTNNVKYDEFTITKIMIQNYSDTRNYTLFVSQHNKWPLRMTIIYNFITQQFIGLSIDLNNTYRLEDFPYIIPDFDTYLKVLDKLEYDHSINTSLRKHLVDIATE